MSDPFDPPVQRRPTIAPLVERIRAEVDAWRDGGYPGATPTTRRLVEHWFLDEHETEPGVPFRWYFAQREAVETLIYLHEVVGARSLADLVGRYASEPVPVTAQPYPRYVVKMATGSGKTKVMSLALTWAYFHAVREPDSPMSTTSLVVAPNLIVYERLREDFGGARVWHTDPLVPPEWRHDWDLRVCLRGDSVPREAPGVLVLTNVQQLYERPQPPPANPVEALLGPRPPANLTAPEPVMDQLARRGRVVVVNDEAHHLHEEVRSDTGEPLVAIRRLAHLHEASGGIAAQFDFTATPRDEQGRIFPQTVVDYPLAQAIEDGIVKRPVIGELSGGQAEAASDDAAVRYRQRIGAGVAKWREFRDRFTPAGRKPLLFVMAEDTTAADQVAGYLNTLPDLAGKVLTIHVNLTGKGRGEVRTSELEQARRWAREVDSDDNQYAAIVSVLMLREGWDVRNVCVIVPLRALSAKNRILPEQTLGRGLRRMTPPGSGTDESVVVIEHEAFRSLWDEALADPEYDGVTRTAADDTHPTAQVVAAEPERAAYDIVLPLLPRVLTRQAAGVERLTVDALPSRSLSLPDTLHSHSVDYTGRDLLTGEVRERATYPLPQADDPVAVLAWYVREVERETRLTGQFALLAPLLKGYIEARLFGGPVDFGDPRVLQALAEPAVQETVIGVLRSAVDDATLGETRLALGDVKELPLTATRPFLWSGETATAAKSVFNLQPCDSGLEVRFCLALDRFPDVAAFAKLAREVRFSLEYRGESGRLAYYYPDFAVRLVSGDHLLVETKGRADLDVPHKDERAARWAVDASAATGVRWSFLRVDEELFDRHESAWSSAEQLVSAVYAARAERLLAETGASGAGGTVGERLGRIRAKTAGVDVADVDAEVRRMRDEPRG